MARKHGIKPKDLFNYFIYKKLIKRENKSWVLTPEGKELGGQSIEIEDGSKWTRWQDDFSLDDFSSIKSKVDALIDGATAKAAATPTEVKLGANTIIIRCLSNSLKEGGRCIAGVQFNPITSRFLWYKQTKNFVWIRPVCKTAHEQVPNNIAKDIKIGDIIEFKYDLNYSRNDYQNENRLIINDELKVIENKSISKLELEMISQNNYPYIFDDSKRSIGKNKISKINYSLMLIKVTNPVVSVSNYQGTMKYRLRFTYKNNNYNLPITDNAFVLKYLRDKSILNNKNEIYLIASIGVEFNSSYWKLIATIFY